MKRELRLRKSSDFERVRRLGESYAHPLMVLIAYPNSQKITRLGIAAGKSVGTAVQRNRAKRLLRASATRLLPQIRPGWDIVLLARRSIQGTNQEAITSGLAHLLKRANLVSRDQDEVPTPNPG